MRFLRIPLWAAACAAVSVTLLPGQNRRPVAETASGQAANPNLRQAERPLVDEGQTASYVQQATNLGDEPDYRPMRDVKNDRGEVVGVENDGNPYVLAFTNGSYTPARGVDPRLRDHLRQHPSGYTYGFVMIRGRLSEDKLRTIQDLGVRPLGLHTWQSYKARIPARSLEALASLDFVHWVGYARPKQKVFFSLYPELQAAALDQRFRIHVNLFEPDIGKNPKVTQVGEKRVLVGAGGESAIEEPLKTMLPNGMIQERLERLGLEVEAYNPAALSYCGWATKKQVLQIISQDWVHTVEKVAQHRAFDDQGMSMIRQDRVRLSYPGRDVVVAVMDSGIDLTPTSHWHQDLRGKNFAAWRTTIESAYADNHGHGTHVAGTVAGSGTVDARYRGAAPGVGTSGTTRRMMIGRYLNDSGSSFGFAWTLYARFAQSYKDSANKVTPPAHVINCSWGSSDANGFYGTENAATTVDDYSFDNNQLYVFAAGNKKQVSNWWVGNPAASKNALTVGGATDLFNGTLTQYPGQRYWASRYRVRDGRTKPEVIAPAEVVTSCNINTATGYTNKSGTSMAAPAVTGAMASLMQRNSFYKRKPAAAKAVAIASAHRGGSPIGDSVVGYGLINSHKMNFAGSTSFKVYTGEFDQSGQSAVWNHTVANDAQHIRMVLCWIEPGASSSSTRARRNNLEASIDLPPYTNSNSTGDITAKSSLQTCLTRVFSGIGARGKVMRVKAYARSVPPILLSKGRAKYAIVVLTYHKSYVGNTPTLATRVDKTAVKPGDSVVLTSTLTSAANKDQFDSGRIWLHRTGGWTLTSMSRRTEDNVLQRYLSTNLHTSRNAPWVGIGPSTGMTVGQGHMRYLQHFLKAPNTSGLYSLEARATYHSNAATAPSLTSIQRVCVDGSAPRSIAGLVSTTHTRGTWSNKTTFQAKWNVPADVGCADIDGTAWVWSTSASSVPTSVRTRGKATTVSLPGLVTSNSKFYFAIRSVDRAGNRSRFVSRVGPFQIDAIRPVMGSVSIDGGAASTNSLWVNISTTATDAHSGVTGLRYSGDGKTWSNWMTYATGRRINLASYGATNLTGVKYCYVQARDRAGNLSVVRLDSIRYLPPPTLLTNNTAQLANLTGSGFNIAGRDLLSVNKVTFGGRTLARWTSANQDDLWQGRYRVLSNTTMFVYPPQGLTPGTYQVQAESVQGKSNLLSARLAASSAKYLITAATHTAGGTQEVGVSQGDAPNGTQVIIAFSLVRQPSKLGNVVTLGIGANWSNIIPMPAVGFSATSKVATITGQVPPEAKNVKVYYQAAYLTKAPLPVTNIAITTYR